MSIYSYMWNMLEKNNFMKLNYTEQIWKCCG